MAEDPTAHVDAHWTARTARPEQRELAICAITHCVSMESAAWDPVHGNALVPGLDRVDVGLPEFNRKRILIWYQDGCPACAVARRTTIPRIVERGERRGYTVHELAATPEALKRFPATDGHPKEMRFVLLTVRAPPPHVKVVPLYDVVEPVSEGAESSPYDTPRQRTRFRSIRNDMVALRAEFGEDL